MNTTRRKTFGIGKMLALVGLVIYTAFIAFPIYWTINSSFKDINHVYTVPPSFVPPKPTLSAYRWILGGSGKNALAGSLIVALVTTTIAVILGIFASYAFSRYPKGKLSDSFNFFFLLTIRMFPPIAFLLPIFWLWKLLGLIDTYPALIMTYLAFNIPLVVWILRSFIDEVPRSLEEASYLDGFSFLQTLRRTTLPLIGTGIAVAFALCWVFIWNEFIIAYLLSGRKVLLYTAFLPSLRRGMRVMWNQISAISVLAIIPCIIILIVFRKYLTRMYLK